VPAEIPDLAYALTARASMDRPESKAVTLIPHAAALTAGHSKGPSSDTPDGHLVAVGVDLAQITSGENRSNPQPGDPSPRAVVEGRPAVAYQQHGTNVGPMGTLRAGNGGTTGGVPFVSDPSAVSACVTDPSTAEGSDASEDGTGRGTPIVTAFDWQPDGERTQGNISTERTPTLGTTNRDAIASTAAVRRLTPVECERLQGYPDGWTAVSDGKAQADSPRYRQLGNSIAVPVFAWVARRIAAYEAGTL
jgi:hypothetical protein